MCEHALRARHASKTGTCQEKSSEYDHPSATSEKETG
jgi:hypothetical protein